MAKLKEYEFYPPVITGMNYPAPLSIDPCKRSVLQRMLVENTPNIVRPVSIFCLSTFNKTISMNEQTFDNSRDNGNSLSRFDSSNMILAEEYPGFKYYIPATRTRTGEPQHIHESMKEGPPSEGFHKDFYWMVKVGDPSG